MRFPRDRLVAGSAAVMALLALALLNLADAGVPVTRALFCLVGACAGVRTPISGGLGLEQLASGELMMAARTAVTQLGYMMGALAGGAAIALHGYEALGGLLAASLGLSALLVAEL